MQECFRQYPEIYGAELSDEGEEGTEGAAAPEGVASPEGSPDALPSNADSEPASTEYQKLREQAPPATSSVSDSKPETDNVPGSTPANGQVPAKWEDATAANHEVDDSEDGKKEEGK